MQNSLYKDVFYEKNQAANSNSNSSSAGRFFISSIKDLLYNSRKKSLIVHSLPFLAILALGVPINPIPELFSTIKIVRKFLMMNLQCLFPKKRFRKLFTSGYLFFHLSWTFARKHVQLNSHSTDSISLVCVLLVSCEGPKLFGDDFVI